MRVLVAGSTGLIGRAACAALRLRGHEVVHVSRHPLREGVERRFVVDFASPAAAWRDAMENVDVAINAVGIFSESGAQTFAALHVDGAIRLFEAAAEGGVRRVIQLSALGADESAQTAFHLTKWQADERLREIAARSGLDAVVLRPSLVFSETGDSAGLFMTLATLPFIVVPAGGGQCVQPIHLDDLVEAICRLAEEPRGAGVSGFRRIPLVGPMPLSLRAYLGALRESLGMQRTLVLSVPPALVELGIRIGEAVRTDLLRRDSWRMLERGNCAEADGTHALLGRPPRAVRHFVRPELARATRALAQLRWIAPLLRVALAAVWIGTAIVSAGVYPIARSMELLARAQVPVAFQPLMLYGAAATDLLLGVATLWPLTRRWRRRLWLCQAGLILGYTAIITVFLPEFWVHPYGPVLKNLPILAILGVLWSLDSAKER